MKRAFAIAAAVLVAAAPAFAACPDKAPRIKWNTHSGDQRVNDAYLQKLLPGKKVRFDSGYESYNKNGSYTFRAGSQKHDAPSYRFYKDGSRCINYANPRFDLYVVNDKRLILVNAQGGRYQGKVTK
ncbi:hypothetical protein LCL97_16080 [Seohaeicola saemankumensis]|nr:hypothetical protein [Seohaeicola saemankumensis]MCA0872353.1 hypothetical protein [Seohaeicola saemankumensis]